MRRFQILMLVGAWLLAAVAACGFQPGGGGGDSMSTAVAAQQTMLVRQTAIPLTRTAMPVPDSTEVTTAETATGAVAVTPQVVPTGPGGAVEPSPLAAADLTGNLLSNGAFEDLAGWGTLHQSSVADETRLEDGGNFVLWERTQSQSDGGAVGLFQDLEADVSTAGQVLLCLDVWVGYHSLGNTGSWSDAEGDVGEMPVHVTVHYLDASGNQAQWSHGFLIQNADEENLQNYTLVPAAEWSHQCFDLMDDTVRRDPPGEQTLPPPAKITQVRLFGNGWDFKGAVGNALLRAE